MIKKYGSFVAGMAAMLLVASLVGSVFAASSPGGIQPGRDISVR